MSHWSEDNFLDRLSDVTGENGGREKCPEAEILSARAGSEGAAEIAEKIRQHERTCPTCSDLHKRLMQFDEQDVVGRDAESAAAEERLDEESVAAEGRLDAWFKGFLSAQSTKLQVPGRTPTPKTVAPPAAEKRGAFWKMQWVLAVAAVIVIAAGIAYIWRSIRAGVPGPEVAQVGPQPAEPAAADSPATPITVAPEKKPPSTEVTNRPKTSKPGKAADSNHAAVAGHSGETAPDMVSSANSPAKPLEQPPPRAAETSSPGATEAPDVAEKGPVQAPRGPGGATLPLTSSSASKGMGHSGWSGVVGSAGRRSATAASPRRPKSPPTIHFAKGTEFWISMESTEVQSGGRFHFTARLLLSSAMRNDVVLERGTVLTGVGEETDGQTVLQITEFVFNGTRYRLKSDAGADGGLAGSGKAVMSESGKGAEVRLESEALFEPVEMADPTKNPPPP
ncbi:MAG TPA: hypothetical protein VKH15_10255 [Candidatus Acidoferrum sp.]|nr:hypothetical protein [Candidatus Acidoferrum sp.]